MKSSFKIRKFPCPWPFEKLGQCFLSNLRLSHKKSNWVAEMWNTLTLLQMLAARGWALPGEEACTRLYLQTSKEGISTAGDSLAQSTVEDRESSRVSEKAAEGKAATQKSSFVTGVCNRLAVVKLEQRLSHILIPGKAPMQKDRGRRPSL